ncbi:MAG: hypothetical protein Sapg2KO_51650 [Saprospiraceae bacterium]
MEKLKTILAIVGLLLMGFLTGFVSHRQLVKKEFKKVARMGETPFFRDHLIETLAPTASQEAELNKILEAHGQRMMKMVQENRQERRALVTQLEEELTPILDEQQKERLKEFNQRFKRPPRRGNGKGRPGGPPPKR